MKLFRKIFLQALLGVLAVSQITFGYLLYAFQKQSLASAFQYEQQVFHNRLSEAMDAVSERSFRMLGADAGRMAVLNAFRKSFGSEGGLYQKGKALYNSSPYEFDFQKLRAQEWGQGGSRPDVPVQKVEDRRLLVFTETYEAAGETYGFLYYKDVSDIYDSTRILFLKGLAMTMGLFVLVGLLMYAGIYRTIRPLILLKEAAAEIAGGRYGVRVAVGRQDEIGQLARSFNHMSVQIQEHMEALKKTNETQRRLLGSLAHELKTPMTAIIGYADTLLTVRLSEERRVRALTCIGEECRRLSRLSVKLLELTGLYEEGKKGLVPERHRVDELLENVKGVMEFKLREKEITLEIHCTPKILCMKMDVDMMTSLLLNLVDNAWKASPKCGKIILSADETGFLVEDEGYGIPAEELERVTEAFYMVDKSRSRSQGSAGLGLALCREIAELHKGQLRIESREGQGTRVRVQLPGSF